MDLVRGHGQEQGQGTGNVQGTIAGKGKEKGTMNRDNGKTGKTEREHETGEGKSKGNVTGNKGRGAGRDRERDTGQRKGTWNMKGNKERENKN